MPESPESGIPAPAADPREVARRLFEREVARDASAPAPGDPDRPAAVVAAERLCIRVTTGMSRWFGPYGSLALVSRALARTQAAEPALANVAVGPVEAPCLTGLADSARTHGERAMTEGVVSLLANLADLIGRLIGADLAQTMLEQSVTLPTVPPPDGGRASGGGHPSGGDPSKASELP